MTGPLSRDAATAAFLDGTAAGRFLLRHCPNGHYSEPSAACCTSCRSSELEWKAAAGRARLVSWAITPGPAAEVEPAGNVLVIAEFEEGPWWWSRLTGADPDQLTAGAPLTVVFEPAGEEYLPVFRLA